MLRRIVYSPPESCGWLDKSTDAKAYLTLSITQTSHESQLDSERVPLYVEELLDDPEVIGGMESLAEEQRQRVKRAAKALGLHWIGETPGAFMYENPDPDNGSPIWEPESSGGF